MFFDDIRIRIDKTGKGVIKIGNNCMIRELSWLAAFGGKIEIGDNTNLSYGVVIVARELVKIGNDVLIGEYTSIRDCDHKFNNANLLIRKQGFEVKPVIIGNDVWIW